jgi:hypothetical protein
MLKSPLIIALRARKKNNEGTFAAKDRLAPFVSGINVHLSLRFCTMGRARI